MNLAGQQALGRGLVIPACPLALTSARKWDEPRQRALFRYYVAAGAGGLAVGVHTTQFAIREAKIGLFKPVLALAAEEMSRAAPQAGGPLVRIAGVCGKLTPGKKRLCGCVTAGNQLHGWSYRSAPCSVSRPSVH